MTVRITLAVASLGVTIGLLLALLWSALFWIPVVAGLFYLGLWSFFPFQFYRLWGNNHGNDRVQVQKLQGRD